MNLEHLLQQIADGRLSPGDAVPNNCRAADFAISVLPGSIPTGRAAARFPK
jgi:hypothetical protein